MKILILLQKRYTTSNPKQILTILVGGKFVSDFREKANILSNFRVSTCTLIDNASFLPPFSFKTGSRINSFHVTENDILAIIKILDPSKTHG